ncbi:MAG: NTP transferase domain-containing protein [Pirellulales bacterium]
MQLVVPMAGAGRRFAEAGYTLPKPLIPVGGMPMVARAVSDLPPADRIVFVCHPDHVAEYRIDRTLAELFPGCRIVTTPGLTEGQACSVRLAAEHLDPERPVLVAACDNTHVYDRNRWERMSRDPSIDALLWTYRRDPRVLVRPEWYGWARVGDQQQVHEVSVKRPLSTAPLDDHVVSGCFWFRSARLMLAGIDRLVADNVQVNNEFYLDSVVNVLLAESRRVLAFEVDKYIGWGTPEDLEDYLRWQRHFGAGTRAA